MALSEVRKAFCKWRTFVLQKRAVFSAHAKQPDKEKTPFSTEKLQLPTAPKLTSSYTFHPRQPTVSLQYTFSFSKKYPSCVCTTVTLSHRFKAFTPAFCRQNRFRYEPPESFTKSFPAELWIVPGVQRFANLWCAFWFFLHNAKSTKNVPFAGNIEVSQTSNQPAAAAASHRNN